MAGGRPRRVRLTNQPRPVRNPTCGLSFLGQGVRSVLRASLRFYATTQSVPHRTAYTYIPPPWCMASENL